MTKIAYRQLGKNGLSVSAISLGCMSLSGIYGAAEDAQSEALIHHAIDIGINHLDSSDMYGWGHNEEVVGRAIKGGRDKVVLASKFGQVRLTVRRRLWTGDPSTCSRLATQVSRGSVSM